MRTVPPKARKDMDELVRTLERALPRKLVRRTVPRKVRRSIDRVRRKRACLRRHETRCRSR